MRRRTFLTAAGAAVVGAVVTPAIAHADYTTTINPGTAWGAWEGWGTSLCWWANVFGADDTLADIFFTTNTVPYAGVQLPGLGLNIARYNAGACSYDTLSGQHIWFSSTDPTFRHMDGFWRNWNSTDPGSASWDWSVDANQRAMLGKARARGATLFELFSDSPMWWMCRDYTPEGYYDGSDNLQSWNYQQHAVYLATIAKYAHDNWGIDFHSVEAFNEPSANWWRPYDAALNQYGTQEGCHFDISTQVSVIGYLRSELDARGLTETLVAASDENTYDAARNTWENLGSATQALVGKINTHGYQYGGGRRDLLYADAQQAGKALWNSEYGDNDATGLQLASNLNLDFRWLHPTAWVHWQAVDGLNWGLIYGDENAATLGAVNTKYYVLAQYSRHIRPGMRIIDGGESNTVAAYDASAEKLVIVTTNYGTAQWINYDLSKFGTVVGSGANGLVGRWATQTDGTGDTYTYHADTFLSGKRFWSWFPANTVQTFEIDNIA